LVKIYKSDKFPGRKKEVIYELGKRGKEDALPILLDYFYWHQNDLSEADLNLLKRYPVSERIDSFHGMDVDDRDQVVARFIKYLGEDKNYDDNGRIASMYTLAILYSSDMTSVKSKEMIKTNENIAVCYGYDEYIDGPAGYIYLKEFVKFNEDESR